MRGFRGSLRLCHLACALSLPAFAQLNIRIDTLTADQLTITVLGGSENAFLGSAVAYQNTVDISLGPGQEWLNFNPAFAITQVAVTIWDIQSTPRCLTR